MSQLKVGAPQLVKHTSALRIFCVFSLFLSAFLILVLLIRGGVLIPKKQPGGPCSPKGALLVPDCHVT
jgi:hypothetical protein